jgi:ADP-ribose pyrophosphatase YjhB (NUDIX family)
MNLNPRAEAMFAPVEIDERTQIKLGVSVLVIDDKGRLLLEKRADCGMWGTLGGKVEPGESIEQCCIREVKEESGLDIEITKFIGVYSEPEDRVITYLDNGDIRQLIDIAVEAIICGGKMHLSHESEELHFFELDHLPEEIIPPAKQILEDYKKRRFGVIR